MKQSSVSHDLFMQECIALARLARQRGDSPVGAAVVKEGTIIGRGIEGGKTHKDITYHAEIEAIRQATAALQSQDLSGCILYTTHEPCIMCSYMIRHTGITTIVMGVFSGAVGGYSSAYPLLTDRTIPTWGTPPQLITGILEEACTALRS